LIISPFLKRDSVEKYGEKWQGVVRILYTINMGEIDGAAG
jgi:hypothetical protein